MKDIASFFDKFKHLLQFAGAQKQNVSDALEKVIGLKLDPKNITIKGSVAYIASSPLVKNELYMKKAALLDEIERLAGSRLITDVK